MRRSPREIKQDILLGSRVCKECKERKEFKYFHRDNRSPDNVTKVCKQCINLAKYEGRKRRTEEDLISDISGETKVCTVCKERKSFCEFHNSKKSLDGKGYRCIACDINSRKDYRARNKERVSVLMRLTALSSKYNITGTDLMDIMDYQRGCCVICGDSLIVPGTRNDVYAVDHNHKTGEVRGLLCLHCNAMLGQAKDSPSILQKGIDYLMEKGYYGE